MWLTEGKDPEEMKEVKGTDLMMMSESWDEMMKGHLVDDGQVEE